MTTTVVSAAFFAFGAFGAAGHYGGVELFLEVVGEFVEFVVAVDFDGLARGVVGDYAVLTLEQVGA